MKLQLFLLLGLVAIVVVACNRKTAVPATTDSPTTTSTGTTKPSTTEQPTSEEKPYQVAGFSKTACFGKCPVFQVKFFSDGKATWYGQMNVERKGWYEAKVDKEKLKEIRDKAHAVKYWDFAGAYPIGYKVADLPSTVTYIRAGDTEKSVVNTHQAPAELEEFEDYLEGIINGLAWKPSAEK
ncbi:MAG: DUF6438 domain-containing protein [Saprospiraceae bacterium]|jgi:hypothetical protein|nr:DUF6438 domain-containing protein [Saprospiraceae bacterium]